MIGVENILKNKNNDVKQILKIITSEQNTKITDVNITDVSSKNKKRYILTVTDNTGQHSMLNKLISEKQNHKYLDYTKNMLLSKMDNYLTSPLHSIIGFSQAMLSGLSGDLNEKQKKYIEIINSNSSELLLFLQKLIELSKIESNIFKPDFQNFDLYSLLSVVFNEYKVKIEGKDIKISVNTSELSGAACYSDKNALKSIFVNLLEIANDIIKTGSMSINISHPIREFLAAKGFPHERVANEKSYLMCEITCKGVDESLYNNEDIFNPYIQADKNSKKYLLQSLLLSSTQKFVKKLKGEIWVNNQYSNQVSFVFVIPIDKILVEE